MLILAANDFMAVVETTEAAFANNGRVFSSGMKFLRFKKE
jgi:hypothetical protein